MKDILPCPFDVYMEYRDPEAECYFNAHAVYLGEGKIKVLAGSQASAVDTGTAGALAMQIRADHLDADSKFKDDVVFDSPSTASQAVRGGATNGWWYWQTVDGKRLNDVAKRPGKDNEE